MAQQHPWQASNSRLDPIEIETSLLEVPARTIPPAPRDDQLLLDKQWLEIPADAFEEDPERWDGMS